MVNCVEAVLMLVPSPTWTVTLFLRRPLLSPNVTRSLTARIGDAPVMFSVNCPSPSMSQR